MFPAAIRLKASMVTIDDTIRNAGMNMGARFAGNLWCVAIPRRMAPIALTTWKVSSRQQEFALVVHTDYVFPGSVSGKFAGPDLEEK
eukprot:220017-Hanusia_phi.AAC.1